MEKRDGQRERWPEKGEDRKGLGEEGAREMWPPSAEYYGGAEEEEEEEKVS